MYKLDSRLPLRKLTLLVLIVLLLVAFLPVVVREVCGEVVSSAVGVRVGDWVKYKVTKSGPGTIWYPGMENALWVKTEVTDLSIATVTVQQTVHNEDGNEVIRESSWNLEYDRPYGRLEAYTRFIIAANHSAGDKIGDIAVFLNNNTFATYVDVVLNDTELRNYDGATKEVNHVKFSSFIPEGVFVRNSTFEIWWEKRSGFLVGLYLQSYLFYPPGYEDTVSEFALEIEDTNMWAMGSTHLTWVEVGAAIIIPGSLIVGYVGIRSKNHRQKKERSQYIPNAMSMLLSPLSCKRSDGR